MRKTVALLCMALAVMLSGQAYISLKDRIDHAHHHAHFANPLAGDISFVLHARGSAGHGDGEHGRGTNVASKHLHQHSHGAGHEHMPGTVDHVHGNVTVVFLAAQSFVLAGCLLPNILCESRPQDFVSVSPRGPDHPPKSTPRIRV